MDPGEKGVSKLSKNSRVLDTFVINSGLTRFTPRSILRLLTSSACLELKGMLLAEMTKDSATSKENVVTHTGSYQFVPYEPKYKQEAIDLLSLLPLWGENREIRRAHLEWKYFRNPYARGSGIRLALHQGKAVAIRCIFPCCWEAGFEEQRYLCVEGADTVVLPEHRRHGLLKKLLSLDLKELRNSPYDFDITLSAGEHTVAANLQFGWLGVGKLTTMHWQGNRSRRLARGIPLLPAVYRRFLKNGTHGETSEEPFRPFQTLDESYKTRDRFNGSGVALTEKPRPEAMSSLAGSQKNGKIRHVRDEQFFAWRYQNPRSIYRFFFLDQVNRKGYLVLQQSVYAESDSPFIVDWEATSTHVLSHLLDAAIRWGGFRSMGIWSATLTPHIRQMLRDHGFYAAGENGTSGAFLFQAPVLVRPLHSEDLGLIGTIDPTSISNWDLRPIYSDNF